MSLRLSATLIAKNERRNVWPCLDSFSRYVDEIVFCDTGSRDGTIAEAERFRREHRDGHKLVLGRFKWCESFGAARTYADSLASGDVSMVIDLDERLRGARHLRDVAAELEDPNVSHVQALRSGSTTLQKWEPLLLRAPVLWEGRACEIPEVPAGTVLCARQVHRHHTRTILHPRRDLDLCQRWARESPGDYRPLLAAAGVALDCREFDTVFEYARRATGLRMPAEHAARLFEVQAYAAGLLGDFERAEAFAHRALAKSASRAESWLALALCQAQHGEHRAARVSATKAADLARTDQVRRTASALADRVGTLV